MWLIGAPQARRRQAPGGAAARSSSRSATCVIRTYVNEVMATNPAPSDSEARAYYDAHLSDYRVPATVTLSHILLEDRGGATQQGAAGATRQAGLEEAGRASTRSIRSRAANGGSLGVVTRDGQFALDRPPAGAGGVGVRARDQPRARARSAARGKTSRGWHVVKVDAVKAEGLRSFDQVASVIMRAAQLSSAHAGLLQARLSRRQKPTRRDGRFGRGQGLRRRRRRPRRSCSREGAGGGDAPRTRIAAYRQPARTSTRRAR